MIKGAKDDDKTSKDDDKASKDDDNNRDDGKQGKHTIFIGPTTILYFLGPLGTWIFVLFGKLCWISNNLYLFFRHDSSTCAPPPAARIGGKAASGTCCNLRSEGAARKSCSCSGAEFRSKSPVKDILNLQNTKIKYKLSYKKTHNVYRLQ